MKKFIVIICVALASIVHESTENSNASKGAISKITNKLLPSTGPIDNDETKVDVNNILSYIKDGEKADKEINIKENADFSNLKIKCAIFRRGDIRGANFDNHQLQETYFKHAKINYDSDKNNTLNEGASVI